MIRDDPSSIKKASTSPLFKCMSYYSEDVSNHRPISHLWTISKFLNEYNGKSSIYMVLIYSKSNETAISRIY